MQPRWLIDHASLFRYSDPATVLAHLIACTSRPGWDRDRLCSACHTWTPSLSEGMVAQRKEALEGKGQYPWPTYGEDGKPKRPGAPEPEVSCAGCWYACLEPNPEWRRPAKAQFTELPLQQSQTQEPVTLLWEQIEATSAITATAKEPVRVVWV